MAADGALGYEQFARGTRKAAAARSRFEGAQGVQGRQPTGHALGGSYEFL
jgi:hypothetical protein